MALYRDVLKVSEYFLFDPRREYIKTALRGYRLQGSEYVSIDPVDGRLPSEQIGLHLEPQGAELKLWDPATREYLLSADEERDHERALREREQALREREQAERERLQAIVDRYQQQFGPLPE
jgi:hypothetical protein